MALAKRAIEAFAEGRKLLLMRANKSLLTGYIHYFVQLFDLYPEMRLKLNDAMGLESVDADGGEIIYEFKRGSVALTITYGKKLFAHLCSPDTLSSLYSTLSRTRLWTVIYEEFVTVNMRAAKYGESLKALEYITRRLVPRKSHTEWDWDRLDFWAVANKAAAGQVFKGKYGLKGKSYGERFMFGECPAEYSYYPQGAAADVYAPLARDSYALVASSTVDGRTLYAAWLWRGGVTISDYLPTSQYPITPVPWPRVASVDLVAFNFTSARVARAFYKAYQVLM